MNEHIVFSRSAQAIPGGIADFFAYTVQGVKLDKLPHHKFYKETKMGLNIAQSFSGEIKSFIHELYFVLNQYYYFTLNDIRENKKNKNIPVQTIARDDFLEVISTTNILKPCELLNKLLNLVGSEIEVECGNVDKVLTNKDIIVSPSSFKQFYSYMPYLCIGELFSYFYFNLGFRIYEVPDLTLTNPTIKAKWIFYPGKKEAFKTIQNIISIDDSIDYTKIAKTVSFAMDDNGDTSVIQPVNPFGKAQYIESQIMKTRFLTINGKLADKTLALRDSVNKTAYTPLVDFISAIQAIDTKFLPNKNKDKKTSSISGSNKQSTNQNFAQAESIYSSLLKFDGEEGNYALFAGQAFIIALLRVNAFFNNVVEYNRLALTYITNEEDFPELWSLIKTNSQSQKVKVYKLVNDKEKGIMLDPQFDLNFQSFEMLVTSIAIAEEPSDNGKLFRIVLEGIDYNIIKNDGNFDISNYITITEALEKQLEKLKKTKNKTCLLPSEDADIVIEDLLELPDMPNGYKDINELLDELAEEQIKDNSSNNKDKNKNNNKNSNKNDRANQLLEQLLGGQKWQKLNIQ